MVALRCPVYSEPSLHGVTYRESQAWGVAAGSYPGGVGAIPLLLGSVQSAQVAGSQASLTAGSDWAEVQLRYKGHVSPSDVLPEIEK